MTWLAVLNFLKSPLARYIGAALAVVLVVIGFGAHERHVQRSSDLIEMEAAAKLAKSNLDQCHSNVTGLQGSVDAQNAATAALKADGDRRAKMLADGLQQARQGRAGAEARAAALLTHPAVGIDACARAAAARVAVLRALN